MKFLMTYQGDPNLPPEPARLAAIGKYGQEMAEKGVLLMTGGLVRPDHGTKLKYAGGKFSVTDGPFAETKELIDGFALVRCDSLAEAVRLAKEFMTIAGDGTAEVLQVFDAADGGPPGPPRG